MLRGSHPLSVCLRGCKSLGTWKQCTCISNNLLFNFNPRVRELTYRTLLYQNCIFSVLKARLTLLSARKDEMSRRSVSCPLGRGREFKLFVYESNKIAYTLFWRSAQHYFQRRRIDRTCSVACAKSVGVRVNSSYTTVPKFYIHLKAQLSLLW